MSCSCDIKKRPALTVLTNYSLTIHLLVTFSDKPGQNAIFSIQIHQFSTSITTELANWHQQVTYFNHKQTALAH